MIGIDTNVLVRYLVGDDPVQARIARDWMTTRLRPDRPGFVSTVVLAETAWVLDKVYRLEAAAVLAALEVLVQADSLVLEHEPQVVLALAHARTRNCDFADALIAAVNRSQGCEFSVTFDRQAAARVPGFERLT